MQNLKMEFNYSSSADSYICEATKFKHVLQAMLYRKPDNDVEVEERLKLLGKVGEMESILKDLRAKNVKMLLETRGLPVRKHGDSGIGSISDSQLLHQTSIESDIFCAEGGQDTDTTSPEALASVAETSDVERRGTRGRSHRQGLSEKTHGQNFTTSMIFEQPIAQASVIDKDKEILLISGTDGSSDSLKQLAKDQAQETRRQNNNDKDEHVLCEEQLRDNLQKAIEHLLDLLEKAQKLNTDNGDVKTKILEAIQTCHKSVHDLENLHKDFCQAYRKKQNACSKLQEVGDALVGLNGMVQNETPVHIRSEISDITANIHGWIQNIGHLLQTGIPIKTECTAGRK